MRYPIGVILNDGRQKDGGICRHPVYSRIRHTVAIQSTRAARGDLHIAWKA